LSLLHHTQNYLYFNAKLLSIHMLPLAWEKYPKQIFKNHKLNSKHRSDDEQSWSQTPEKCLVTSIR